MLKSEPRFNVRNFTTATLMTFATTQSIISKCGGIRKEIYRLHFSWNFVACRNGLDGRDLARRLFEFYDRSRGMKRHFSSDMKEVLDRINSQVFGSIYLKGKKGNHSGGFHC